MQRFDVFMYCPCNPSLLCGEQRGASSWFVYEADECVNSHMQINSNIGICLPEIKQNHHIVKDRMHIPASDYKLLLGSAVGRMVHVSAVVVRK